MKSVSKTSDHKGASILVAQLAYNGLTNAVISPGSRNAPLTIAFDAHPDIVDLSTCNVVYPPSPRGPQRDSMLTGHPGC